MNIDPFSAALSLFCICGQMCVVVSPVWIGVIVWLLWRRGKSKYAARMRDKANWLNASGYIVKVEEVAESVTEWEYDNKGERYLASRDTGYDEVYVVVGYYVKDKLYQLRENVGSVNKSAFRSQMPDEGQKVLVRYNPAKPQDAELGEKIEL